MSDQDEEVNFSEDFSKLEKITESFENDEFDLEEGIEKFEEGMELAEKLKNKLNEAENKIEKVKEGFEEE
ncbi:MAG: exodeoxyribonuclease VII small subunit [Candidatus Magasanikbacteria bacterium]